MKLQCWNATIAEIARRNEVTEAFVLECYAMLLAGVVPRARTSLRAASPRKRT